MQSWMIGVVLGILPVGLLPRLPEWPLSTLAAGCALGLLAWPTPWGRLCAGLALGIAVAVAHGESLLQRRLKDECVKLSLIVEGQVSSLPRRSLMPNGDTRQRFDFSATAVYPEQCQGPRQLLLSYYGPQRIVPGQRWQFRVHLKKPWGLANPGSFNMQAWFAQTGIDGVGTVSSGGSQLLSVGHGILFEHHRLRQQISDRISELDLQPDVQAILRAITVADKSGIDAGLWVLLQQFGINHLLVISGLHIGLVAGAGYLLGGTVARLCLTGGLACPWLPGAMALVLACGYAALAGFSLATQRALCMLACFIIAGLSGRGSSSVNNLLLAAVVVLLINPLAPLGSGFWLSFGAVAVLLWLACWQRGMGKFRRLLYTHGFMSLAMLPMSAWWFGGGSMLAALANVLMIPLVGFVVVPLALVAAVCFTLGWALDYELWQLAAWPLQHLLPVARQLADVGDQWLYRPLSPGPWAALLALLAALLLLLPAARPIRLLALLMALPLALPRQLADEGPVSLTRVTVLDVGQGTAVVVRTGRRVLVYDTGGGDPVGSNMANSVVLPFLRSRGIAELDTLVISHPDTDHSAGATTLLGVMPVGRLRYGDRLPGVPGGQYCVSGEAWRWPGGPSFQFLSPALEPHLGSNDRSCVLQIQVDSYRLLLLGDIERARERELVRYWGRNLRQDWLLVAHHGSATSSTHTLLKVMRPAMAVVSSGYANRFGHPHPDVLQRLRHVGARVLSTAESGALEFEFAPGEAPRVNRYRLQNRRFWM